MKSLLLLLTIAAIAFLLWLCWPTTTAAPQPAGGGPETPQPATASGQGGERTQPADGDRVPVGPVPPDATATTGTLHVVVRWPDGEPAAGLQLVVDPRMHEFDEAGQRFATTGDDGTATVTELPVGYGQLRVDWRGGAQFAIVAGRTTECEVQLPAGVDVRGIVVDEGGQPVPTARIWLSTFGRGDEGMEVAHVARDGTFLLRALPGGGGNCFLAAIAQGLRTSTLVRVRGEPGTVQDVRIELRFPGVALCGRVFLPGGRHAAGARVLVGTRNWSNAWHQDRFIQEYRPPVDTRCDEQGHFRADGLSPGSSVTVWLRGEGSATLMQDVQLLSDRDSVVQFDLFTGATFRGVARGADGEPMDGVSVVAKSGALFDLQQNNGFFFGPQWAASATKTGSDGRYELPHVTAGMVRLDALTMQPPILRAATSLPARDRQELDWDPVLGEGATIQGFVRDGHDEPLAGWIVEGIFEGARGGHRRATTDAQGHFVLADCGDGVWRVSTQAPDAFAWSKGAVKLGVPAGTTDVQLVVPLRHIPDAAISGRLQLADGSPPAKGAVSFWRQDAPLLIGSWPTEDDGSFRLGLLPMGTWRVRPSFGDRRGAWSEPFALRPGEALDLGVLRPGPQGSVQATVRDADGKPLDGVDCQVVERVEGLDHALPAGRTQQGALHIDALPPGDYRLRVSGRDLPVVDAPFTVVDGQETAVALTVPASVPCTLRLLSPSEGAVVQLAFAWSRDGKPFFQHTDMWHQRQPLLLPRRLVPGAYELAITSETGKREVNRFTVAADDGGREIEIKLP